MLTRVILLALILVLSSSQALYDLLEISPEANSNEIKKAFRKLSIKYPLGWGRYHPDKNVGDPNA